MLSQEGFRNIILGLTLKFFSRSLEQQGRDSDAESS